MFDRLLNNPQAVALLKIYEKKRKDAEKKKIATVDIFGLLKAVSKAIYLLLIGPRDDGKSYPMQALAVLYGAVFGGYTIYLRRTKEMIKVKNMQGLFDSVTASGFVSDCTGGEYDRIYYHGARWYFAGEDPETHEFKRAETPFMVAFDLNTSFNDRSSAHDGNINLIWFEEAIEARGSAYLDPEREPIIFNHFLSTMLRNRTDVPIVITGNTWDPDCPYFSFFGVEHVEEMKPGQLDLYRYARDPKMIVAVKMTGDKTHAKPSNIYFDAFDAPELRMITGQGLWNVFMFPHLDGIADESRAVFRFWIASGKHMLRCFVMSYDGARFLYVRGKLDSEEVDNDVDLIYCRTPDPRRNWRTNFKTPKNKGEEKIRQLILQEKVFFQTNRAGAAFDRFVYGG